MGKKDKTYQSAKRNETAMKFYLQFKNNIF